MHRHRTSLSIAAVGVLAVCGLTAIGQPTHQTLQNLQAAYNGESNARARYLAFAEQAQTEGYARVAVLFRAAARAEEIHLNNHAAVIRQLGAVPTATIQKPVVGLTKENLESSANKGEAYERDTMYPQFIKTAQAENLPAAVKTFEYAREAEAEHYKLFTNALEHLDQMRSAGTTYYVCKISGFTSAGADPNHCVASEYEQIK